VPKCSDVLRLAQEAGPNGRLATVERPLNTAVDLNGGSPGAEGRFGETAGLENLVDSATYDVPFDAPVDGVYEVGIDGSWRSLLELSIDGQKVAAERQVQNWPSEYEPLAAVRLKKGRHLLTFHYTGPDIHPASAGVGFFGLGPVLIGRTGPGDRPVKYVSPAKARTLCGKSLDWVEAVRPAS